MKELYRLRAAMLKSIENKEKRQPGYTRPDNKLFIADNICLELIVKIEKIEGVLNEVLSHLKLSKQPSLEFNSLFPSLPPYKIPDPIPITKPPQGYISLRDFTKIHPGLISLAQSGSFLRNEFKDSWIRNKRQWFLDEIKYLKFLLTKDLYRDRILARREKYANMLSGLEGKT